ncbi:TonB family protein [Parasphingopyxis sp.]|uniref:TonB family protein n=1 Tax=Parasphingopyxis sp. TaxID=1920299 RepID=UPI00261235AD|nr:TonB family protein [Parasphingopyxis sp.]
MSVIPWSSAISPARPPIPANWHWALGLAIATLILVLASWPLAQQEPLGEETEEAERIVVSLGGPPQRLEAPPVPQDVQTPEEPPVATERDPDAPPPTPPDARPPPNWTQASDRLSSGRGAERPVIRRDPPPPAPGRSTAEIENRLTSISTRLYSSRLVYPQGSLLIGEEGVGRLRIVIARAGDILEWELVQSTGHWRLDHEIERVARRITRVDPLPADYRGSRAEITIPISFIIQ